MSSKLNKLMLSVSLGLLSMTANADGLHQIYQQALQGDPQIKQAKANRDSSFAAITESRAVLLPQISGTISLGNRGNDATGSYEWDSQWSSGASVTLTQQIYSHGSWLSLSLSEKSASRSDAQLAAAQQGLILRVANAYFDVLKNTDSLSFVQAEKRAIERQLEQTKQRFEVGLNAFTDVHEAQAQFDLSTANEIMALNSLQNSLEVLTEITGLKHSDLDELNTDSFSAAIPKPASSSEWIKLAEENNLTLLDSRLAQDIAKQRIDLAKSGHLPTLGASLSADKDFKGEKTLGGSIGLQLNVPIYKGGATTAQVDQSRFGYVASAQKLEQDHRSVVRNVRNNFNNVRASISSIKAYEQAAKSADSALKATEAGFEVGTRTIVDVLNSTRQVYNSKRQLSDARYSYILSVLSLKQTAGTLKEQDLILISKGLK